MIESKKQKSIEIAKKVFEKEITELKRIMLNLGESFIEALEMMEACTGRIVVTGIGKSGLIGRKIAASLSSTGTPSLYMNAADGLHGDLGMIRGNDVVFAISNSGKSSELIKLIPSIKKIGAKIIVMTSQTNSPLARDADLVVDLAVKEEADDNKMIPTSSTTATLVFGDALTISLMKLKNFSPDNFAVYHPGGEIGKRLLTRVADVMQMKKNVAIASKTNNLLEIVDKLTQKNLGIVCIEDEKQLIGIITDGDIRRALNHYRSDFFKMKAEEIMTKEFISISENQMLYEALDLMESRENKITSLPVLRENVLLGLVRLHDIYKFQ